MKKQLLISMAIALSWCSFTSIPAQAREIIANRVSTQQTIIPKSTAIVVAFPQPIQLDLDQSAPQPITLLLAQPILDNRGQIVIPANSPVAGRIIPIDGNARIAIDSLIVKGKVIPIQASSQTIAGQSVRVTSTVRQAKENAAVFSRLSSSVIGAVGGNSDRIIQGGLAGNAVGILLGIGSKNNVSVANIAPGSVYVLTLNSDLVFESQVSSVSTPQSASSSSPSPSPLF